MSKGGSYTVKNGKAVLQSQTKPQALISHAEKIKAVTSVSTKEDTPEIPTTPVLSTKRSKET